MTPATRYGKRFSTWRTRPTDSASAFGTPYACSARMTAASNTPTAPGEEGRIIASESAIEIRIPASGESPSEKPSSTHQFENPKTIQDAVVNASTAAAGPGVRSDTSPRH